MFSIIYNCYLKSQGAYFFSFGVSLPSSSFQKKLTTQRHGIIGAGKPLLHKTIKNVMRDRDSCQNNAELTDNDALTRSMHYKIMRNAEVRMRK